MKTALALALAVAVTAPAFARTVDHNPRRGLRAYDYTTQGPANTSPNAMHWDAGKAGGGSMGYNTHNEVSN